MRSIGSKANLQASPHFFSLLLIGMHQLRKKTIRGNNKPFMNKELSKAIKNKSRLRNKYNKWKSRENYLEYQKSKKLCKFIAFKAEKLHFEQILSKGTITNKDFWKKVAPALSSKEPNVINDIILDEDNEHITDDDKISQLLNDQYINIVENSTGMPIDPLVNYDLSNKDSIDGYIDKIIKIYENHPSIKIMSILLVLNRSQYLHLKLVTLNKFLKKSI